MQENFVLYLPVFCPNTEEISAKKARIHVGFMYCLDGAAAAFIFFFLEEAKETILDFSQGTVKAL